MKIRAARVMALVVLASGNVVGAQTIVGCDDRAAIEAICGGPVAEVVCINDFVYDPPVISPHVGDTVAWVNVESCGDNPVEAVVVPNTGCNPRHWVLTEPAVEPATGDHVALACICSASSALPGLGENMCSDLPCQPGESNVGCHTFTSPGVQQYTCITNEGHHVLMHGLIAVQP